MKNLILLLVVFLTSTSTFAQSVKYEKINFGDIQRSRTINVGDIEDAYMPQMVSLEAPNVSGESYKAYLHQLKQGLKISHPGNSSISVQQRSVVDDPIIINDFFGNNTGPGTPLDNHLAISSSTDQLISVINRHIAIMNPDGEYLKNFSLSNFLDTLNVSPNVFDPRVIYDTEADRFIIVYLAGSSSGETDIVLGFSATNNAEGIWNLYSLPGNPNENTTWTDYPMIALTETDFIITGNLIRDNESWQLGFDETVIWQVDKMAGYNGEDLGSVLWKDIEVDGINIRNLCPVTSADEDLESNLYFLSNRNFAVENDTFFMVELTGGINDPNATVNIDVVLSDVNYGVPPDGRQPFKSLQTNDARVLEAIYLNDEIQFVGNSRNLTNNFAGIYHGSIFNVSGSKDLTLEHIHGDTDDYGYPGISWTGYDDSEFDVIISMSHAGPNRNPGNSCMYYRPGEGYSNPVTIKEGETFIDMLNGTTQRWGDYSGSQRRYDKPGEVWVSASYGINESNFTWIGHVARPDYVSSVENINLDVVSTTFPNPSTDLVQVKFKMPNQGQVIRFDLLDANGVFVDKLFSQNIEKRGESLFSFNTSTLSSGQYLLKITVDNKVLKTEKLVVIR